MRLKKQSFTRKPPGSNSGVFPGILTHYIFRKISVNIPVKTIIFDKKREFSELN